MRFIAISTASAAVLAGLANAQSTFVVNTPLTLQECTPSLLSWTGGTAPFTVQVTAPGNPSSILETVATGLNAQSYTWNVNQPSGQKVTIVIVDSTGISADSGPSNTINSGSSTW
jgi:hypothetical protein